MFVSRVAPFLKVVACREQACGGLYVSIKRDR